MKSGHSVWAKYQEVNEVIDLHGLFSDYWSSNNNHCRQRIHKQPGKKAGSGVSRLCQYKLNRVVR